jgi:hypothetical protein
LYSKHDVNILLSLESEWFKIGTRLYILADQVDEHPPIRVPFPIIVGREVGIEEDDTFLISQEFKCQAGMLYAMAVEAWLKGLLLKQASRGIETELESQYLAAIGQALDGNQANEAETIASAFWEEFFKRHCSVIQSHKTHNLERLARSCGMDAHLNENDLAFLCALSSAIERGRYPATFSPEKMELPDSDLADVVMWGRINNAIKKRFDELFPNGL